MTTNNYQQLNLKKQKQRKQLEQEQNHRNRDHMEGYQQGGRGGYNVGDSTGNKKHKWQVQNRQMEIKNSMGNGEAKELICTTLGHELRWGNDGEQVTRWRGNKGEK